MYFRLMVTRDAMPLFHLRTRSVALQLCSCRLLALHYTLEETAAIRFTVYTGGRGRLSPGIECIMAGGYSD